MSLVSFQAKNVGKMAEKRRFFITFVSEICLHFITPSTHIELNKYIKNFFINVIICLLLKPENVQIVIFMGQFQSLFKYLAKKENLYSTRT